MDVLFILLVFLVLSARFTDTGAITVTAPTADAGPRPSDALIVTLTRHGAVRVGGADVDRSALEERLRADRASWARLVLLADREGQLQQAVDVIAAARRAGFESVALATVPTDPAP